MTSRNVLDAMGGISPDMIAEAAPHADQRKRGNRTGMKWGTVVAACLCLTVAIGIAVSPRIYREYLYCGDQPTLPDVAYCVGTTLEGGYGRLVYRTDDFENHTLSFTLTKDDDAPICVAFSGYQILEEWTDEQGVMCAKVQYYSFVTPQYSYQTSGGTIVVDDALRIYVNGEESKALPTEVGTYEITIDYSAIYDYTDYVYETVGIVGFGTLIVGASEHTPNQP